MKIIKNLLIFAVNVNMDFIIQCKQNNKKIQKKKLHIELYFILLLFFLKKESK